MSIFATDRHILLRRRGQHATPYRRHDLAAGMLAAGRKLAAVMLAGVMVLLPAQARAVTADPVVVGEGHADLGPRFVDGAWRIQLRDDTVNPTVWRDLDGVVVKVGEAAEVSVPADPRFTFLGTPGATVWLLPQVQQPGVLWLGWNTQDPPVATGVRREVTWRLHAVTGAGSFLLFLNAAFGDPQMVYDSAATLPQQSAIEVNTHVHGNWVFTEPGEYLLDFEMSAVREDGVAVTDRQTLRVHVGDGASAPASPTVTDPGSPIAPPESAAGISTGRAIVVGGASAAVLTLVLIFLKRRRGTATAQPRTGHDDDH